MNNDNLSNLNDIYLIVSSTNFKRTPELLEFLDVMIQIEEEFTDSPVGEITEQVRNHFDNNNVTK